MSRMSPVRSKPNFVASVAASLILVTFGNRTAAEEIQFNRDVRPILSDKCFFCHGPDRNHRKADLRLDVEAGAKAERDGVVAIAPGEVGKSELVRRIFNDDEDEVMPPPDSGKSLTAAQKETLKKWIEQGAPWEGHWAYVPPTKRELPETRFDRRAGQPFDRYIFARLEGQKLAPAGDAGKRALIRRVSLDLTGLPPTPAEVGAFVADDSHDAYERLVDRLLSSPHYGERMAVPWLDVVRYADTVGYHGDQNQNVFPYRDYVIDSFNSNKPFDRFTIEQLAGDLLEDPTAGQLTATAFNRLNMMTREGGAQEKEYLAKYGADRVRTVTTTWLGSTFACAECHDHKFDPITIDDFYAMKAYFADIKQWGVYADYGYTPNKDLRGFGNDHPFPPEIWVENDYLKERLAQKQAELDELVRETAAAALADEAGREDFAAWQQATADHLKLHRSGWSPTLVIAAKSNKRTQTELLADGSVRFTGKPDGGDVLTVEMVSRPGVIATLRIQALPDEVHGNSVARDGRKRFGLGLTARLLRADGSVQALAFHHGTADKSRTRWSMGLPVPSIHDWWESDEAKPNEEHHGYYSLKQPVAAAPGDRLLIMLRSDDIGRVRIATSPFPVEATQVHGDPASLLAAVEAGSRSPEQTDLLHLAWLGSAPSRAEFHRRFVTLRAEIVECRDGRAPVQVVESREPDVVRVLPRGNWQDDSGAIIEPHTPAFLQGAGSVDGRRQTRLDLARWIVSTDNPLTARVFVNRVWKQFFGAGLSGVLDDLGNQGEWPVYPEVLDWLAVDFMEHGWDVKRLVKTIVTSDAYRRASNPSGELVEADPNNRLLGRQSPRRLPAELVRDNALAVAGLLVRDIGGPSVMPYQPGGYYEHLNFPRREYQPSTDDRQFRRGVYSHWQRTFPHPMLANFDAPSREECTADRTISNTPQQALTLLNDPSFVEAARRFAGRVVKESRETGFAGRLEFAFREALARDPKPDEHESLKRFYEEQFARFSANEEDAKKLLSVGISPSTRGDNLPELAAWTSVCRVLLNLHETLTRY